MRTPRPGNPHRTAGLTSLCGPTITGRGSPPRKVALVGANTPTLVAKRLPWFRVCVSHAASGRAAGLRRGLPANLPCRPQVPLPRSWGSRTRRWGHVRHTQAGSAGRLSQAGGLPGAERGAGLSCSRPESRSPLAPPGEPPACRVLPLGPGAPGMPLIPLYPGPPGGPLSPNKPGSPLSPERPFMPTGPGTPVSPGSPLSPGRPESQGRKESRRT